MEYFLLYAYTKVELLSGLRALLTALTLVSTLAVILGGGAMAIEGLHKERRTILKFYFKFIKIVIPVIFILAMVPNKDFIAGATAIYFGKDVIENYDTIETNVLDTIDRVKERLEK